MRLTSVHLASLVLGVAILACNAVSPQATAAIDTPTVGAAAGNSTPAAAATTSSVTETPAPSDTELASAATISPLLTSVPGIAATLTAVYSAPGVASTVIAQQTMAAGTQAVLLPQLSTSLLKQCPNPSDPPKQSWVDVPVMPQATAGQEVQTLIGSYYCFRAPATVQEMEAFYKEQLAPPRWVLQSDANGAMEFIGVSQAGMQILFLVSGPGSHNDLLVAINVTRPIGVPTP